jgi:hypothetical protein
MSNRKNAFVAKQIFSESTYLVIMDPTSSTVKNVTPHCPKLFQVLEYFKRVYNSLCSLKKECEKSLGVGQGAEESIEELSEETIKEEMLKVSASFSQPSTKIFYTLMNLTDVTQCDKTLDE